MCCTLKGMFIWNNIRKKKGEGEGRKKGDKTGKVRGQKVGGGKGGGRILKSVYVPDQFYKLLK